MKKILLVLFVLTICISLISCDKNNDTPSLPDEPVGTGDPAEPDTPETPETPEAPEVEKLAITWLDAYGFFIDTDLDLAKKYSTKAQNRYEDIIYSAQYGSLYRSMVAAIEEIGVEKDVNYSNICLKYTDSLPDEEWKNQLLEAYDEGGKEKMLDKYGYILRQKIINSMDA